MTTLPVPAQKIPTFEEVKKDYLRQLMKEAKGNIMEAVRLSGISRANLYRLIAKYGVQRYQ